jgi:DNA modification methylase
LSITNEGDTVLDPFMGSGSLGEACQNLNRKYIGIELSDYYFEVAKKRLSSREALLFR